MADNKRVQQMRLRSRTSLEKSAQRAGVKGIGRKNKLQLARDIDQARKDDRNRKSRAVTAGRKFANRPEGKRNGIYVGYRDADGIYHRHYRSADFWRAYKEAIAS